MDDKIEHKWIQSGKSYISRDYCDRCRITKGDIIKSISTKKATDIFMKGGDTREYFIEQIKLHYCLSDEEIDIRDIIE